MNRRHRRTRSGFLAGILLSAGPFLVMARDDSQAPPARPRLLPYQSRDQTLGVVTCASSLCHGSITEWQGANVKQNEYVTWLRVDKHAGAARLLLNAQSKRIAQNLGLRESPDKAKICLDCHAHNPSPELRGDRFKVADGVACEACHGPSEHWIAAHTAPGRTHAENVAAGLYPTDRPIERARLCLSCHFGNADRFVTHRIMGAGHPRLSFELETFSHLGPSHVRVDRDYETRKGSWNGAKVWAIGQALAVEETMKILTSPTRGRDGLFPELVLFDCYACHHPMSERRWTPRNAFGASPGPGTARLNDSNMLMLRAIMRQVDPSFAESLSGQISTVNRAAAGEGDVQVAAGVLGAMAARAAELMAAYRLDDKALRGVTLALIDEGLKGDYKDFAGAEQSVMAIGSVLNYMNTQGLVNDVGAINRGLQSLRDPLANDESYRPADLLPRLQEFRKLVEAVPSGAPENVEPSNFVPAPISTGGSSDEAAKAGAKPLGESARPATRIVGVTRLAGDGIGYHVDADGMLSPDAFLITNPNRLVLDFKDVGIERGPGLPAGAGPVKRLRLAQFSAVPLRVARLVLDLDGPVAYRVVPDATGVSIIIGDGPSGAQENR